ncbi:hypothetical protein N9N67_11180 [Bacteriovoracaceae bacterium]|nr:hypothetical protein [Bacteriovoracaceae bacterium]
MKTIFQILLIISCTFLFGYGLRRAKENSKKISSPTKIETKSFNDHLVNEK